MKHKCRDTNVDTKGDGEFKGLPNLAIALSCSKVFRVTTLSTDEHGSKGKAVDTTLR